MYQSVVGLVVVLHFAFIGYVVLGGFLALRWRRTIWLHVAAVIWGIAIAAKRVDCPLTWAERWARARAAMAPLPPDGFIAHYITGVIYPAGWVVGVQLASFAVVALSWALYGRANRRRNDRAATRDACDES
ncbi:MAG TPA: DUF2784 domain-containing protein [Mycobacterium sp.]|nr:DUF2784 domain-containing protein [Mycobacterium sp.]